jgi:hypothetical protein
LSFIAFKTVNHHNLVRISMTVNCEHLYKNALMSFLKLFSSPLIPMISFCMFLDGELFYSNGVSIHHNNLVRISMTVNCEFWYENAWMSFLKLFTTDSNDLKFLHFYFPHMKYGKYWFHLQFLFYCKFSRFRTFYT